MGGCDRWRDLVSRRAVCRGGLQQLRADRDELDDHVQRYVGWRRNSYSYRVRATDTAGDLGAYSNVATTTTGFSVSPNNAVLTFSRTQQYTAQGPGSSSVTWQVDGVAGGSASTGRITSGGVYTPPSAAGTHTIAATNGTDDGERHGLRVERPGHVHLPQRQHA